MSDKVQSRKSIVPPSRRKTERLSDKKYVEENPITATSSFYSPLDEADKKIASQLSSKNLGKVIYMGMCFLVMYTGLCASNLIAEIYDQLGFNPLSAKKKFLRGRDTNIDIFCAQGVKSLGQISSIVFYGIFAITALFSAKIMEGWSYKKSVFLGSVGYVFPLAAGVLTAQCEVETGKTAPAFCADQLIIYGSNCFASVLNGISAAVLWIGVNQYITACSNESNRGRYMGIFYGINALSGVVGNLMSNRIIHTFGKSSFFMICTSMVALSVVMILCAPSVDKYEEEDTTETVSQKIGKIFNPFQGKK